MLTAMQNYAIWLMGAISRFLSSEPMIYILALIFVAFCLKIVAIFTAKF